MTISISRLIFWLGSIALWNASSISPISIKVKTPNGAGYIYEDVVQTIPVYEYIVPFMWKPETKVVPFCLNYNNNTIDKTLVTNAIDNINAYLFTGDIKTTSLFLYLEEETNTTCSENALKIDIVKDNSTLKAPGYCRRRFIPGTITNPMILYSGCDITLNICALQSSATFYNVLLHELLHVIGLDHPEPPIDDAVISYSLVANDSSLQNLYQDDRYVTLQPHDIASMHAIVKRDFPEMSVPDPLRIASYTPKINPNTHVSGTKQYRIPEVANIGNCWVSTSSGNVNIVKTQSPTQSVTNSPTNRPTNLPTQTPTNGPVVSQVTSPVTSPMVTETPSVSPSQTEVTIVGPNSNSTQGKGKGRGRGRGKGRGKGKRRGKGKSKGMENENENENGSKIESNFNVNPMIDIQETNTDNVNGVNSSSSSSSQSYSSQSFQLETTVNPEFEVNMLHSDVYLNTQISPNIYISTSNAVDNEYIIKTNINPIIRIQETQRKVNSPPIHWDNLP